MSQIFVAEFPGLGITAQGDSVTILPAPPTTTYNVIVSAASSGPPQPLQVTTRYIEVSCDTTCSFSVALFTGGAAKVTDVRLAPNERITRAVPFFLPSVQGLVSSQTAYGVFTTANV
jgi:hypothetical protein